MNTSPEKIYHLIQQFHSSDFATRKYAVRELAHIGPPAINTLLLALQDKNWLVRANAADALAAIGDAESISVLVEMLQTFGRNSEAVRNVGYADILRALHLDEASGTGNWSTLARNVVRANHLTTRRRVDILEQIRRGLGTYDGEFYTLPAPADLCRKFLRDKDDAVRRGAGEILAASTLLRASSFQASPEPSVLLRAAQGAESHDAPEQLLRGSTPDNVPVPSASSRTVWQRLWAWLFRRKVV